MFSSRVTLLELFFVCVFRVNEFNTKEFKRQVDKAKTCRELIDVLKVSVSLVDVPVLGGRGGGGVVMILMTSRNDKNSTNSTEL